MEIETNGKEENVQNSRNSSSGDQQQHSIVINRPRLTIKPPTRYSFEYLISCVLINNIGDYTIFLKIVHNQ